MPQAVYLVNQGVKRDLKQVELQQFPLPCYSFETRNKCDTPHLDASVIRLLDHL